MDNSKLDKDMEYLVENIKKLKKIEMYNIDNLIKSYNHQLASLIFFYNIANKNHNKYFILKHRNIEVHTLMYVNLGRGFPKEFMDGHWCYIVKKLGDSKVLIIPTASLKGNDKEGYLQRIIKSYNPKNKKIIFSKLKYSDIRAVDIQRLYFSKGVCYVKTPRKEIMKHLNKIIGI
ncbi:MAG: hypothetical protein ACLRYM_06125 [Thomasclavelia ramosa]